MTTADQARMRIIPSSNGVIYPGQTIYFIPYFSNDGPGTADRVTMESTVAPGLKVTEVYGGPCRQTGEATVACEWPSTPPRDRFGWTKISVTLDADHPAGTTVSATLALTAYRDGSASDRAEHTITWQVKHAPTYPGPDSSAFPHPRTLTVRAVPSAESERRRLAQQFVWADFQPTGYYLNPHTDLFVTVTGLPADAPSPELIVGTPALAQPENEHDITPSPQTFPLTSGTTTVRVFYGGLLYLRHTTEPGRTVPDVTVTLGEQALPVPLYRQGITTQAQWAAMLEAATVPLGLVRPIM
ncbi:M60 family peptidase N-terminal accessory domain-containing protein [Streptomyces sp. SudanB182_2057]|uniref:M60 family peptidase N-terminal accessory domain-containing protein n=1 Tax=Streptomyces sp. SudanB182_2057 TaxID=3035281 RepID=UPI003F55A27D